MNKKSFGSRIIVAAFTLAMFLSPVFAAEPKPLSKGQAAQLLTSMGYQDVEVGAIVPGFAPMTGSPNVATVLGIGRREGKVQKLELHFFYDADIGWFGYEYDGNEVTGIPPTKLGMWTLSGYKEFRPKMSLTDSAAAQMILGSWKAEGIDFTVTYTKEGQWKQTGQGSTSTGAWKIDHGVIISTWSAPSANTERFEIISLDKSAMVLRFKNKDGSDGQLILRRSDG